jgi:hypothetical protein
MMSANVRRIGLHPVLALPAEDDRKAILGDVEQLPYSV